MSGTVLGLSRTVASLCVLGALGLAAMALLVVIAAPAQAHGRASDATNFSSTVASTPDTPGVTWQIWGGDEYLSVVNESDAEIVVLGYAGEPYLRITPDRVERNERSPATYQNADRYADVAVPDIADPDAPPQWVQVSSDGSWYWHDHRVHWMSPTLPPQVRPDPGARVVVDEWEVSVLVDGRPAAVTGALVWVPGPPAWPWLVAGLVLTCPALLGLRHGDDVRRLARPAAVVLAACAAVNLVHLADDLLASPLPLTSTLFPAAQTAAFIAVGVFGAQRAWRGGDGALAALGVGSAALFVGQGLLYLSSLTASQVPSVTPEVVGRLAIGASLAQLLTVGAVAVIGTRRTAPPLPPLEAAPEQQPSAARGG